MAPVCRMLAAGLALASACAHAEFQDDYALGLKAIDAGRYDEARKYLGRALEAQSTPVDKVILNGDVEQPYLPYHFLGIVAFKLGECDVAKAQWSNPVNRRMIGRLNQIRQLEQRLEETCQQKTAKADNSTNAQPAPPAERPAETAAPVPAADKAPPPLPAKPAEPVAEKLPATSRTPAASAERAATKPADGDKAAAAEKPETAERAPPPRLVRALEAYLAGRYAEAARIEPDSFRNPRARFHALLIRAAARYTLAGLGDTAARAGARDDAAAAFRIDAGAQPDPIVFSPAFRTFYAQAH